MLPETECTCEHCGHEFKAVPTGGHRLLCGDSTNAADVARLMGGAKADMVFTDPPYNCADEMSASFYANTDSPAMRELSVTEWDKGFDIAPFLEGLSVVRPRDGTVYICTSHRLAPEIWAWMSAEKSKHHGYVVWCKSNPMPSLAKRHPTWATELICYATFGKHAFNFPKEGHALSWWDIRSNSANRLHPTQKPVGVIERAIGLSSNIDAVILDPFVGSGTTIIAAEMTERACYALEIAPQYVDVSVLRWQQFTGKQATLDGDGRTLEEVREDRIDAEIARKRLAEIAENPASLKTIEELNSARQKA